MQIYIIVVLLVYSGTVSGGLEKVLRLAEFIGDIYQQFPHSCIFIINSEAQQQGEDKLHINYINCVIFSEQNFAESHFEKTCCELLQQLKNFIWNYIVLLGGM